MKYNYLLTLLLIVLFSCKERETEKDKLEKEKLQEQIILDYQKIPKSIDYNEDRKEFEEYKRLIQNLKLLKKTDYGRKNEAVLKIAEFKIHYLFGQKEKAIAQISEIKDEEYQILKKIYTASYLELENKSHEASLIFNEAYNDLSKKNSEFSTCWQRNIILILSANEDLSLEDCEIENLPDNYFDELKEKSKKEIILDTFFRTFQV